jgi:glycosyltransferase involved in cell wall biosynthesis
MIKPLFEGLTMRIVYLCHYFYPEMGAPATRVLELATEWVKMGHEVTVVTCFPNHPTGIIPKNYRGCFFRQEMHQGIRVFRNFVLASRNKGIWRRTICHLSFMVSSVVFSMPRLGEVDLIIASSPTFFAGFSARFISRHKKIPFIFEVRDLWPAAITELGVIKSKLIIKILESWELYLYRCAQKVIVVTQSFKKNLVERGIPATKIEVVYNGVDLERFGKIDGSRAFIKQKYGLEDRFIILYSGALGLSHSLEYILLVADRFRRIENILFLFAGEGAMKEDLQGITKRFHLKNVMFWPGQPRELMPEIYALADICIVSLKKVPLFTKVIPSKIFEIMASSRPIVACLEGEAAQLLKSSGSAIIIPQENLIELQKAIQTLFDNPSLRRQMGQNGLEFVTRFFDRKLLAGQYEAILKTVYENADQRPKYDQAGTISKNTTI